MNYLLDKQAKRKRFFYVVFFVFLCLVLFYFRLNIFTNLSYATHTTFRPVLFIGNKFGEQFSAVSAFFSSKSSLYLENEKLRIELDQMKASMISYDSVKQENKSLKEILGRKTEVDAKNNMILTAILSKPNQSPYDTIIIDSGIEQGLKEGNVVFAFGNIPIGRVGEVYASSAKVILFSSQGEKTEISVRDIFGEIVGRGGGNFEMILPRDFTVERGDRAVLPNIDSRVVAIVEEIISDPRDSFKRALLVTPVNIFELKFVEVEKN